MWAQSIHKDWEVGELGHFLVLKGAKGLGDDGEWSLIRLERGRHDRWCHTTPVRRRKRGT